MAIETDNPGSALSTGQVGRVHAYDAIEGNVAHPLWVSYAVREDLAWRLKAPGPRCRHCLEIVGPEGRGQ
jgi:hypothetical protein